ncbi:glycosyltransferase [Fuchsiella alkaliacetigena]|uniref:glycosyltransferase n=1 Tax=Fuchsiella alkaliacetigena TaxID=957042 RepID=UPI00200A9C16|nr:glycosyltransferase [Fuchsiella alkaliacetigena]MCK8823808.1 glycosyltransferase [Fuchsiella alkaliacetigena]
MHIAMFTNNYKPFVGGVPISIESFANEFRKLGHQVTIFAPEYKSDLQDEQDIIRIPSLKMIKYGDACLPIPLSGLSNLKDELLDLQVDLVHSHHPFFLGRVGQKLAHKLNLPMVYTYHTRYTEYCSHLPAGIDKICATTLEKIVKVFCNDSDLIFTPTKGMTDHLIEMGINTKIEVIPTGIDFNKYSKLEEENLELPLQFAEQVENILLFVGRLGSEKNIDFLISSLEQTLSSRPRTKLLIVGDGPERESLVELTVELGIEDKVIFMGNLEHEQLIKLYKLADLFVFSSLVETQGIVILEAFAGQTPVVALEGTGVRDIITSGEDGFLLTPGDSSVFREQVERLLVNDELRARMGQNALQKAKEYNISNLAEKVLASYRRLKFEYQGREKVKTALD